MSDFDDIKAKLNPFCISNPCVSFDEIEVKEGQASFVIGKPWNDDSVEIVLPEEEGERNELVSTLNRVRLFPKFSAVYFPETSVFEVLFSAYKLPESSSEVIGRSFAFNFEGEKYECSFTRTSEDVLSLSKHTFPKRNSETNYRNVVSFHRFARDQDDKVRNRLFGTPISFCISNVPNDEDQIVHLAENLNFYMSFYDIKTPRVLIHDDDITSSVSANVRYRSTSFPAVIEAIPLDENILSFWRGAFQGNELLKFMLYFRIIEYTSLSYANEKVRRKVLRLISKPNFRADLTGSAAEVLELFNASDNKVVEDFQRFTFTVAECVDPKVLWKEIEANKDVFAKDFICDGGFCIKALVASGASYADFSKPTNLEQFARQLREIRNALSHGKDFPRDGVFRPTKRNLAALRPWAILAEIAAGDILVSQLSV